MSLVEDALRRLRAEVLPGAVPVPPSASQRPTGESRVTTANGAERATVVTAVLRRPIGDPARCLTIDLAALRREGMLAPESQDHQLAQQFRTLKRPLIKSAFGADTDVPVEKGQLRSRRLIMVSSALPGDGKTFTAINLALSLAKERDYPVLLVDGDVAKPHISRLLGVADEEGLFDALTNASKSVESLIMPTTVDGLSLLPVGRRSESVTELLSSARMRDIVQEMVRIDPRLLVVVDSPPIMLTSEARVLASLFGQVLLVVRSGVTPQGAVAESLAILGDDAPVKLVLNEAIHGSAAAYYGYGYGDDA